MRKSDYYRVRASGYCTVRWGETTGVMPRMNQLLASVRGGVVGARLCSFITENSSEEARRSFCSRTVIHGPGEVRRGAGRAVRWIHVQRRR